MDIDIDKLDQPKFSINGTCIFVAWLLNAILYLNQVMMIHGLNFWMVLVLQLLKSAQMQHGLRHGDYTRYRYLYLSIFLFN